MTRINKINFKDLLRNAIEKKLKGNRRYFSREDLRNLIPEGRSNTLNRYLVDFNKEGVLHGAGRGWYSFIKQSFELDRQAVKKIAATIEKNTHFFLCVVYRAIETIRSSSACAICRLCLYRS